MATRHEIKTSIVADQGNLSSVLNGVRQQFGSLQQSAAATGRQLRESLDLKGAGAKMGDDLAAIGSQLSRTKTQLLGFFVGLPALKQSLVDLFQTQAQVFQAQQGLKFATGDAQSAASEYGYLRKVADDLGVSFQAVIPQYVKLAAATKGTALEGAQTRAMFEALTKAATTLGMSNEDLNGSFKALTDIVSKGKLQAEELRGQLGDRLPGAVAILAKSLGVTTAQLDKLLEKGELTAEVVLPALTQGIDALFGASADEAAKGPVAALNRLKNAFFDLQAAVGKGGFSDGATKFLTQLTEALQVATPALASLANLVTANAGAFIALAGAVLAVKFGQLVGAIGAKVAATQRAIAADVAHGIAIREVATQELIAARAAAATAVQNTLTAQSNYLRMRAAGEQAVALRTLAAAEATYATAAAGTSVAMRAASGVASVARGALTALGGPVGALTLLLLAGAAAWAEWGNSADKALKQRDKLRTQDSREEAIKRIRENIEKGQLTDEEKKYRDRQADLEKARNDALNFSATDNSQAARTARAVVEKAQADVDAAALQLKSASNDTIRENDKRIAQGNAELIRLNQLLAKLPRTEANSAAIAQLQDKVKLEADSVRLAAIENDLLKRRFDQLTDTGPKKTQDELALSLKSIIGKAPKDQLDDLREQLKEFEDEIGKTRARALERGLEISPDWEKKIAAARKRFLDEIAKKDKEKGAPTLGSDITTNRALETEQERRIEAEYQTTKTLLDRRNKELQDARRDDLISLSTYYDRKEDIEQDALSAEVARATASVIALQDRELALSRVLAERRKKGGLTKADEQQAEQELIGIRGQIATQTERIARAEQQRGEVSADRRRDETRERLAALDKTIDLKNENLKRTGVFDELAIRAAVQARYRKELDDALANESLNPDQLKELRLKIDLEVNREQLTGVEQQISRIQDSLAQRQQDLRTQIDAGIISEVQGREALVKLNKQYADQLDALVAKYKELALASKDPAVIQAVENLVQRIKELRTVTDEVAKAFDDAGKNALSQALSDIISGSKNASDAIRAMSQSIIKSFSDIIAKRLGEKLYDSMFKGLGAGMSDGLESVVKFIFGSGTSKTSLVGASGVGTGDMGGGSFAQYSGQNAATGGYVTGGRVQRFDGGGFVSGPGTGTSDSIPARLSNGEFVVRAARVQQLGLNFMRWVNGSNLAAAPRFATGGLADVQRFASGGMASAPSVSVVVTPEMANMTMRDWLEGHLARELATR